MIDGEQLGFMIATSLFLVIFVVIAELVRTIRAGDFRFSLRTLLIATTLVAFGLGVIVYAVR
jgi:hypothetical protein